MQMDDNNTGSWNTEFSLPVISWTCWKAQSCVGLQELLSKGAATITKKFCWTGISEAHVTLSHLLLPGHQVTLLLEVSECVKFSGLIINTNSKRADYNLRPAEQTELHWALSWYEFWLWHAWLTLYGIGACGQLFSFVVLAKARR